MQIFLNPSVEYVPNQNIELPEAQFPGRCDPTHRAPAADWLIHYRAGKVSNITPWESAIFQHPTLTRHSVDPFD